MNKTFNGGNACFECLAAWRINHRYGASFGRHRTEPTLLASLMLGTFKGKYIGHLSVLEHREKNVIRHGL